jgi:uroporphyrinogen decarboxylase
MKSFAEQSESRLLAACRRQPVDRPPVWLMRQAGRYLPEYRETRARAGSFLDLVKTPALAAEVTLQPIRRFPLDAAIVFSDILIPLEPMGLTLTFDEGKGPRIENPVRTEADARRLRTPPEVDIAGAVPFLVETIRTVRRELPPPIPLIGFAGAPYTVAAYAVEGAPAKGSGFEIARAFLTGPHGPRVLEAIARVTVDYLVAQAQAGAQVLMLFDTWAGTLSPEAMRDVALKHARDVIAAVREVVTAPIIYFAKGTGAILDDLPSSGADVIGVDASVDLSDARKRIGDRVAIQGNLDNAVLLTDPKTVREGTQKMLEAAGPRPGYIANLGHGILPETPVECVEAFVETVAKWVWPTSPKVLRPPKKQ